ncbi:unnamed protein product [Discosporangium mesarthrocarpum]
MGDGRPRLREVGGRRWAGAVRGERERGGLMRGSEVSRLQCFLGQNLPKLLRDLMGVVDLESVNHENICCLNTAVLILIFAHQRGQLAQVCVYVYVLWGSVRYLHCAYTTRMPYRLRILASNTYNTHGWWT